MGASFSGSALGDSPKLVAPALTYPLQPQELGAVPWLRDFEAARSQSRRSGLPLLVLFDEVPGCHTCVSFGEQTLSHPLIVDAAATLLVPVAVFNNIEGADREVLRSFDEPEWNNPVVRIMDADRRMLAPRVSDDYSVAGVATAMAVAIASAGAEAPPYLQLLAFESSARRKGTERATFAMHCFWEGEARLGAVEGVVDTRVGFLDEQEVVEVEFDPTTISFADLLAQAKRVECAHKIFTRSAAQQSVAAEVVGADAVRSDAPIQLSAKDLKYHLGLSPLKAVPMTPLQAARVNAALAERMDPHGLLSPSQIAAANLLGKHSAAPSMIGRADLVEAWAEMRSALSVRQN